MTHTELNTLFTESGKTAADFIQWCTGFGVRVTHPTVSRHRAGTQGITAPWAICYKVFFQK